MAHEKWKQLNRKKVFDSRFVNVYEDTVELPDGTVFDDYTVVEKPSIVMIVATDEQGDVVVLDEYKYAANEVLATLPAGHKKKDESSVEAAKRELLEETGYTGDDFEELTVIYDYPTKDIHKVHVVRAKNVAKTDKTDHEATESIEYKLVSPEDLRAQIVNQEWKASSALAALTVSGVLF